MNITYSKRLGRRLLLVFLTFVILFSITFYFVRSSVTNNLQHVSNVAINASNDQSRPERALLLLHLAEDNFQQSLLDTDHRRINEYKVNLSEAFEVIDTLLKEQKNKKYGKYLNSEQREELKFWHSKKVALSSKFYNLKHSFDSLLFLHGAFQKDIELVNIETKKLSRELIESQDNVKIDTSKKSIKRKGIFARIKDAITNKSDSTIFLINRNTSKKSVDVGVQKITSTQRNLYQKKLKLLQLQNIKLQSMQRQLTILNTNIINKLEHYYRSKR
ncbi:MAG: hypothetical protein EOO43_07990 [Flavobacterium sp.]|nr:MAG: hypothetical protein EOO43_07990 [Flavobacterium sp.]